jgi:hypothetical protein
MSEVTADISISLDGYASGRNQSREHPFGDIDEDRLHAWQFAHRDENSEEAGAITLAGAFVMGRAHRPRPSVEMEGGTTYHFVTEGIETALERAREAAGEKDVSISGGPATLNQYLAAGLIDELRLHVAPFVAGTGERVFDGVGDIDLKPVSSRTTPHVTHLIYRR